MKNIKGYGFRPSDEELIGYLDAMTHDDSLVQYITQLDDICEFEPWELAGLSAMEPGSRQWYFFYSLNYKYQNGKLINRATGDGYWKPTGSRRKIKARDTNTVIGSKRSLTFQNGRLEGKTKKKNSKTKSDNDKNKTKHEDLRNKTNRGRHKRNKAVWVLHEYQLNTATLSNQKTFFLGKLMKQSEDANISNNNGESSHSSPTNLRNQVAQNITTPEDQLDSSKRSPEVEISNDSGGAQYQFSTQKQDIDVQNGEGYPREGSNQDDFLVTNEVSSLTNNLETYASVDPISRVQPGFHEPVEEMEVSNDTQNQSCISEQANETVTSFPVHNYTTYPEGFGSNQENFVNYENPFGSNQENFVNYVNPYEVFGSNQENFVNYVNPYEVSRLPFSPGNYVPDDAIPQGEYMKLITAQVLPNMYNTGAQSQLNTNQYNNNSSQNLVSFYNNETYPFQSSIQQNVLPETEGINGPYDSNNNLIPDLSQMNFSEFDDLHWDGIYFDELFGALEAPNNHDGVQNQSSINQHADEFRTLNSIKNQIVFPDERNKPAAADTEGSNLPSVITESSYPIMESFRKRSPMENEGSSMEIEDEVA